MAAPSRKIFELLVTKIPWTSGSLELKAYFGQFGTVTKCFLPFNRDTGFHKGFCKVSFKTEEELNNALQKDSHMLEGTKIHIQRNRLMEKMKLNRDQ